MEFGRKVGDRKRLLERERERERETTSFSSILESHYREMNCARRKM